MTEQEAREICERFATKYKLVFDDAGECGFGRECVGIRHGDDWVSHNPISLSGDYDQIPDLISDAYAPPGVNAYHKHDCLAVLGRGPEAIAQLATWIQALESRGTVEIVSYETGATGMQALLSGLTNKALVVRKEAP